MYSSTPPPGWYDNPVGDGQRFWDGQQWTRQVRLPWPEPPAASAPPPPSPPPPPGDRTILQSPADHTSMLDYPPTTVMPAARPGPAPVATPIPMERVRRNVSSQGRGPGRRAWLAIGGVGVLAVLGAAAAVSRSGGETDAGSAPGPAVAVAPLAASPSTDGAVGAPAPDDPTTVPAAESASTAPAPVPSTAAPAAPTTAAPTTQPPTTKPPTTAVSTTRAPATAAPTTQAPATSAAPTTLSPTTREPTTSAVETTVPNAVTPGAFCSPEGSTGLSAKGVAMICSSVNAQGVPYGEGKSRWRSA